MRHHYSLALLSTVVVLAACSGPGTAHLDTDAQKASYGIGRDMGRTLKPAKAQLDIAAFWKGIEDELAEAEYAVSREEIQTAYKAFTDEMRGAQARRREELAAKNLEEGKAFLEENAQKDGVMTTDSGLQYEVLRQGDGPLAGPDDTIRLNYKGTLIDGTVFDSSYDRGEPAEFAPSGVIAGFGEALQMMPMGSHYRITIPSDLAYGAEGGGRIGPNSTLVFEIETIEIVE